jgi:hypothetical protein
MHTTRTQFEVQHIPDVFFFFSDFSYAKHRCSIINPISFQHKKHYCGANGSRSGKQSASIIQEKETATVQI